MVQQVGNRLARSVYEAGLPDNFRRPQTDSYPLDVHGPAAANARSPRGELVSVIVHLKLSDDRS